MVGCRIHHGMTGGIYCHDDVSTCSSAERAVAVEGPQQVFRDPGYPLFEVRNSGFPLFEVKDSGLVTLTGCGMPKITIGITGLSESLVRDDGIKESY